MNQQQSNVSIEAHYEFQAGVTACLRTWSALRTAVEVGWGPTIKADELRTIIFQCMDGTSLPKKPLQDILDLEDYLAIYMEEEFGVTLEDGSEQQVASMIFQLYELCCFQHNFTLARQLVSQQALTTNQQHQYPIQIQSPPEQIDDDDDDDDDIDDNDVMDMEDDEKREPGLNSNAMETNVVVPLVASATTAEIVNGTTNSSSSLSAYEYASQPLFGTVKTNKNRRPPPPVRQLGESISEQQQQSIEMDEEGFVAVSKQKIKGKNKPM